MRNNYHAATTRYFLLIACSIASSSVVAGDPALHGYHPLSQKQAGSVLIAELRCAACHTDVENSPSLEKIAPDLTGVGTRVAPEYLQRFLASPSTAHPGTTMPDMLTSKPESERRAIAEALTHFLIAESKPHDSFSPTGPIDRQHGEELFHSVGCVACHGTMDSAAASVANSGFDDDDEQEPEDEDPVRAAKKAIRPSAIYLDHVPQKYSLVSLSDFLFQPLRVRSSGRMPDMKLSPDESLAIADYLIGEQGKPSKKLTPDTALVEAGKKHFQELNCAACHAVPGFDAARPVGSLKTADLSQGCMSKADGSSPKFELDNHQVLAIAAAIQEEKAIVSDNDILAMTLTSFRCIACHVRDDYGGVHDAHNAFFKGSQLNLGDDGRIPPPLTLVGAKLQPTWMKKVLFDGESVRHYMSTRMPMYGSHNLQHLPDLFRRLDVLEGREMRIPNNESGVESEQQEEKLMRAAGRELLGDKGANCVACHNFNGKAANVNQGIDLLTSNERLQPGWFHRYLQKPSAFRPRTVMPSAWPDGVASFTNILDGDTDRQIEAIWYYLSLGTSAADPSGVRATNTKLDVAGQTVIHRGRSRVAGFRGIAVGLPEKMNYAFNAETGTMTAIWSGDFINVNWSGQGSGDFHPANAPITLAQDVSFASLASVDSPWPLLPVMTKESPTNPNPLYPKNVGYQFRGYYLDEHSVPIFQYRSGTLEIEDHTYAIDDEGVLKLKRMLQLSSPEIQTVWFRAFVGDFRRESERVYGRGDLRLTVPMTESQIRPLQDDPKQLELLLQLQIPNGESTMELIYEPLKK